MPDVPAIGAAFWEEPPKHWYEYESSVRNCYSGEVFGRNLVYAAFEPQSDTSMPLLSEGLGEWRVYAGFDAPTLIARFPYYPRSIADSPDFPDERRARNAAMGYGWRMAEEKDDESDVPTTVESEAHRTKIEPNGRYDELVIDGVPTQSVAIDHEKEPPELIVHDAGARWVKSFDPNMPSHVIELPSDEIEESEN
jgi:hypothetical protein